MGGGRGGLNGGGGGTAVAAGAVIQIKDGGCEEEWNTELVYSRTASQNVYILRQEKEACARNSVVCIVVERLVHLCVLARQCVC